MVLRGCGHQSAERGIVDIAAGIVVRLDLEGFHEDVLPENGPQVQYAGQSARDQIEVRDHPMIKQNRKWHFSSISSAFSDSSRTWDSDKLESSNRTQFEHADFNSGTRCETEMEMKCCCNWRALSRTRRSYS